MDSEPRKDPQPTCVPFVLGFLLTYTQLRVVAANWLSAEVLASCENDYRLHFRLVGAVQGRKDRCTFLRTTDNSGEPRCLWVIHVIPSFDGKRPECRMPEASIQLVLNVFGFDTISVCCQRWPQGVGIPEWFVPAMIKSLSEMKDEGRRVKTEKGSV